MYSTDVRKVTQAPVRNDIRQEIGPIDDLMPTPPSTRPFGPARDSRDARSSELADLGQPGRAL